MNIEKIVVNWRGLYSRVAKKAKVDPSYVSRIARGERPNQKILNLLIRECKRGCKRTLRELA